MIGAARMWAPRMWAPRYWPKVGADAAVVVAVARYTAPNVPITFVAPSTQ